MKIVLFKYLFKYFFPETYTYCRSIHDEINLSGKKVPVIKMI